MGKTKFLKALSNYYDEAQFTIAAPQTMINSFTRVGGNELSKVFADFIEGKEIIGKLTPQAK